MAEFRGKRDRVMVMKKHGDNDRAIEILKSNGVEMTKQNLSYILNHGTGRRAKNLEEIFDAFEQVFNERKSKAEG